MKMKNKVKKLFIIGNGFDCYGHGMKTKYSDFKEYLINRFPDYDEDFDGLLESRTMPDGEEEYDMDAVVGSIVRLLNNCSGKDWGILEACLGDLYIENIQYDNEWNFDEIDFEDDNTDEWETANNNEDLAKNITGAYAIIRELFEDWVFSQLGSMNYVKIKKLFLRPSFLNSVFLNFNYTKTLEKLYGISPDRVCHIHGDAENKSSTIYFGHGDNNVKSEVPSYLGTEDSFDWLKEYMKKDTKKAIENNQDFFSKIKDIRKIYTYGFSFSQVDMIYMKEIANAVDLANIKWYFNRFDWKNNKEYVEKVKILGFKVRRTYLW